MEFKLRCRVGHIVYRMQVIRTLVNNDVEEFEVKGGDKIIVFRCNRPEWRRKGKRRPMPWKVVSISFAVSNSIKEVAERLLDLQDRLEDYLEPTTLHNKKIDFLLLQKACNFHLKAEVNRR